MAKRTLKKRPLPNASATPMEAAPTLGRLISAWRTWLPQSALIVAITVWIYWPALRGELIWDDGWYVAQNPLLKNATGLWRFWFQPGSWVEYYPIHETVLWLQYQLFGADTLGYHLTNLALHLINAFLVWHLFRKLGLRFAWLGGLIFAVHPVQVDSVAYICELKNTLSLAFALLAMGAWIDYEVGRSERDSSKAIGFFFIAMLCKITMAPFAAVILLYAWWKRGRIAGSDFKACAPFLLIAIVLTAVTVWSGAAYEKAGSNALPHSPLDGPLSRLDAVGLISALYFARCFLPIEVQLVYPQWPLHPFSPVHLLPWLVLAGMLAVLWQKRAGWGRHVFLGLGFFFILLSPFLGLVVISYMEFTWALDHMLYLPIIGAIGLAVAGIEGIHAQIPTGARRLGIALLAVVVALMAGVSHRFAGYFATDEGYWSHIVERNPSITIAHTNLASKYLDLKRYPDALVQEDAAIAQGSPSSEDIYNRGLALEKLGRDPEAKATYEQALRLNPGNPNAYLNLSEIARRAGDVAGAEEILRAGLKTAPDNSALAVDLAGVMVATKRLPEAIDLYRHAAEISPDQALIQYDLGNALMQAGSLSEAADHLASAVNLDPTIAGARQNLGSVLAQLGRFPEAIEQFQAVLQLNPNSVSVRYNLAMALTQSGNIAGAIEQFQQVLQRDPNNAKAVDALAKLQQYQFQHNATGSH